MFSRDGYPPSFGAVHRADAGIVDDDGAVGEDVEVAAACRCVCGGKTHFGMPRQEQQQLPVLQSGASFAAYRTKWRLF